MKKLLVLLVVLIAAGMLFAAPEYHVEETWNGKPGGTFYWGLGRSKDI